MTYTHEHSPTSSTISHLKWEGAHQGNVDALGILSVTFVRGKIYRYADVPLGTFFDFRNAQSAGRFFAASFKGAFQLMKDDV